MTPINTFDAFNLKPGGEYKFQVTPRNRYGWGESVTMTNPVRVSETVDLPEFTRILPGQLKVLEGTRVKLECEVNALLFGYLCSGPFIIKAPTQTRFKRLARSAHDTLRIHVTFYRFAVTRKSI